MLSSLTLADRGAVALDSVENLLAASLNCAVTKTVAEAWVAAKAAEVGWAAAAKGRRRAEHVGDAHATALVDAVEALVSFN